MSGLVMIQVIITNSKHNNQVEINGTWKQSKPVLHVFDFLIPSIKWLKVHEEKVLNELIKN